ncbi:MAG TPA: HAD-IA family hydrolase [Candidatus Babeliales bacterium]|nr:HAD-IA family hydrolase [Candidatus Babeliales bacterium]
MLSINTVIFDLLGVLLAGTHLDPHSLTYQHAQHTTPLDPQDPYLFTPTKTALTALQLCQQQHYEILALTNLPPQRLSWLRQQQPEICAYFTQLIAATSLGYRKNDPKLYAVLAAKFNFDLARTLFIDDTLENIQAAQTAGLTTLWCQDNHKLVDELTAKLTL